uniref:Uncharacterized protein n=1 Tax=Spironucleus salmonicida TaxID=348837 RepID=V6LMX9_9EUKA|eukprot:EST45066.1 Hypothetical protein SS50377_15086 [Spironucleus salmonicida]
MTILYQSCFGNSIEILANINDKIISNQQQILLFEKLQSFYFEGFQKLQKMLQNHQINDYSDEFCSSQILNIISQQSKLFYQLSNQLSTIISKQQKLNQNSKEKLGIIKTKSSYNQNLVNKLRFQVEKDESLVKLNAHKVQKRNLELELNPVLSNQTKLQKQEEKLEKLVKKQFDTVEKTTEQEKLLSQFEINSLKYLQKIDRERILQQKEMLVCVLASFKLFNSIQFDNFDNVICSYNLDKFQIQIQQKFQSTFDPINVTNFKDYSRQILTLPRGGTIQEEIEKAQQEILKYERFVNKDNDSTE